MSTIEKVNMVTAQFAYDMISLFRQEAELYKSEKKVLETMTTMCQQSLEPKLYEQFEIIAAELIKNRKIIK